MSEQGRKYDGGKLRYDLVPALALEEVVKVITKGAEKYDPENWKRVPEGRRRYYAAAMRHMEAWRKGERQDEIGTHHIANAISNLMFILEKELQGWEDVSEENVPEVVEDISEQECVDYHQKLWKEGTIQLQSEVEQEEPWYPPVEDGGNPWIEWNKGYRPEILEDGTIIQLLSIGERVEKFWDDYEFLVKNVHWKILGDQHDIVAYRVV